MKTVERAHSPKNLWERITLSRNYSKAMAQLDEHLAYFPKALVHRNKQRLTKIHQYLIRMRKIELKARSGRKAKVVGIHRKIEQREERRERKALVAAKLEKTIEKELVQRLAKGTYGDIYNFPEMSYNKALDEVEEQQEQEEITESESEEEEDIVEYVEDLESEEEEYEDEIEDMEYMGDGQWGQAGDGSSEDDGSASNADDDKAEDDDGDMKRPAKKEEKKGLRRRGPRVEIEYEEEREDGQQEQMVAETSW